MMLNVSQLTKVFGGLTAVNDLSFNVNRGEIVGLIGPNGAGKTTIFNLLTGAISPSKGDIIYEDRRLNGLKPHQVCKIGLTRTFQVVQPFPDITVLENALVGAFVKTSRTDIAEQKAKDALARVGLLHKAGEKAKKLTLIELKQLEIAKALATEPQLLLLDEVAAGLNLSEIDVILDLVRELNQQGITLLIVEHVMKLIMNLSHRIIVINFGRKIAEGSPEDISANPEVIQAYFGKEEALA